MSAPISKSTALAMISAYETHTNTVKTLDDNGNEVTLKGLRVDRASLESILANTNIEEVFLALAVKESDLPKPTQDQYFTLVCAGITNEDVVDYDNAYDEAKNCPPDCPAS
jgi:hypothetical protein